MLTAMSAGSVGKEKSTTMIELHCSNKGPGGFPLGPFFLFFSVGIWALGCSGGGLFHGEKDGGRRVLALERGGKRHPPRAPWHDAWRLKLNVVRNILFWAFWSAVEYNK